MDKIDAEITLGQFVYRNYFPNSALAENLISWKLGSDY
jgi:hypothetical protein